MLLLKRKFRLALFLLALTGAPTLGGCAALYVGSGVIIGAGGTYYYTRGNVAADYQYPLDEVWGASLAAVAGLNLKLEGRERDKLYGLIRARATEGGHAVQIHLKTLKKDLTEVSIRVGAIGDPDASAKIHDKIIAILKK